MVVPAAGGSASPLRQCSNAPGRGITTRHSSRDSLLTIMPRITSCEVFLMLPRAAANPTEARWQTILLSIIVPCYNEQEVLHETHRRLTEVFEHEPSVQLEIVYVDDGSRDGTLTILREMQAMDRRVRVVSFSRNFGHQFAVTAGLDHAAGDAVCVIDAD